MKRNDALWGVLLVMIGLLLTIEHDRTPFDDPEATEQDPAVTELAREIISRASELLHATVSREPADNARVKLRVSIPQRDPAPGPPPRLSSGFTAGVLAAASR